MHVRDTTVFRWKKSFTKSIHQMHTDECFIFNWFSLSSFHSKYLHNTLLFFRTKFVVPRSRQHAQSKSLLLNNNRIKGNKKIKEEGLAQIKTSARLILSSLLRHNKAIKTFGIQLATPKPKAQLIMEKSLMLIALSAFDVDLKASFTSFRLWNKRKRASTKDGNATAEILPKKKHKLTARSEERSESVRSRENAERHQKWVKSLLYISAELELPFDSFTFFLHSPPLRLVYSCLSEKTTSRKRHNENLFMAMVLLWLFLFASRKHWKRKIK